MREIKFRGKALSNGEWVCGSLLIDKDKYYIGNYTHKILYGNKVVMASGRQQGKEHLKYQTFGLIEVNKYSIGQYTGLKDKNGKEIYEGDIVEWAGIKMEIFWGEDIGFGYGFCWRNVKGENEYHESMTGFIDEYEVIGNIYDNPELLEQ